MGLRKSKGGGGGGGGAANIRTIILGVITIVVALIMLGIAMDVVTELLTGGDVDFTDYPGGEAILSLFPLLMMIGLVLFGGVLIWVGYGGHAMGIKETVMVAIVVVIAVILLPIVIEQTDTLLNDRVDIDDYAGLASFLGLVPLLYVVGVSFATGLLGFKAVRGKIGKKAAAF